MAWAVGRWVLIDPNGTLNIQTHHHHRREVYIMEFQFGDFGGTLAMFVQAVSRQEPFSGKESLR